MRAFFLRTYYRQNIWIYNYVLQLIYTHYTDSSVIGSEVPYDCEADYQVTLLDYQIIFPKLDDVTSGNIIFKHQTSDVQTFKHLEHLQTSKREVKLPQWNVFKHNEVKWFQENIESTALCCQGHYINRSRTVSTWCPPCLSLLPQPSPPPTEGRH